MGKTYHEYDIDLKLPSQSYGDGAKKFLRSLTSSAIAGVGVSTWNSISKSIWVCKSIVKANASEYKGSDIKSGKSPEDSDIARVFVTTGVGKDFTNTVHSPLDGSAITLSPANK